MEKFELQILRDLPIEQVAERLGMKLVRHKSLCPFHADHHPFLSFNPRRNTYRCFVCDAHGGTIDLVMHLLHKDFKEACQWLGAAPNRASSSPPKLGGVPAGGGSVSSKQPGTVFTLLSHSVTAPLT